MMVPKYFFSQGILSILADNIGLIDGFQSCWHIRRYFKLPSSCIFYYCQPQISARFSLPAPS